MESSLREQVQELITEYSDSVKRYFATLSAVAENVNVDIANSPEQIIKQMALIDNRLQEAVEHIESHQNRQQQILQVQDQIQLHNVALLEIIQKLGTARDELDLCLTEAKVDMKATKYAHNSNLQFTDVLSYASKLAKYTSAPPNFETLKGGFEKPYPDEEKMRRGALYWQDAPQQKTEDRFESSDSEASGDEDMVDSSTHKQAEDAGGDPFWVLDLNPDMQS